MSIQPTPRKHRNQALDEAMFLVGCYVAGTGLGLAAVIERADTGELYRTPWCTDRYWTEKSVDHARSRGDFPRMILRCRAKQEARDR